MKYQLVIPPSVEETLVHLPPRLKKKIRAALQEIQEDPHLGKPLRDKLKNLWSYQVDRYRIVYRIYHARIEIQVIDIGHRNIIYQRITDFLQDLS